MTRRPDEDPLDPRYWSELSPGPGPDVTDRVLRRLGIMPAARALARRRRTLRAIARYGLCVLALGGTVAGVYLYQQSVSVAPGGPTIASAIRNDVQYHAGTIDHAIRSIRNLSPVWVADPDAELPGLPLPAAPAPPDRTVPAEPHL